VQRPTALQDRQPPASSRIVTAMTTRWSAVLATAVMTVALAYFALPVWFLIVAATKSTGSLIATSPLWFGEELELFEQFRVLFTRSNGAYGTWLLNSALYSLVGAGFATLFAGAAGYTIAKLPFRGSEAVFSAILGGVLVPGTALVIPLYLMMSQAGMTNTYWSVLLPSMVSPFGVYLARVYASSAVPTELLEAARVDGLSEVGIFFRIAVPVMTPALVTIMLFQFVAIWNNFFLPLVMLSDDRIFPVTLGLYGWTTQYVIEPELIGYVAIGAAVSVVPLVVAFVGLQKYWRGGLTEGSVKA
jgi:multiple sugar transport system permease protein